MEKSEKIQPILLKGGKQYFEKLHFLINSSTTSIVIHTYIFELDQTGNEILSDLNFALKRGVDITILIDAFGSNSFPKEKMAELKHSGIKIRMFSPIILFNRFQIGRRLHYKTSVFDSKTIIIGGINFSDNYSGKHEKAWLDYAVLIENSSLALQTSNCLKRFWTKRFFSVSKPIIREKNIEILINDRLKGKNQIISKIKEKLSNASKSIIITGTYFLPDKKIFNLLSAASKRNVNIKIIFSEKSDVWILKRAGNYLYKWILQNNIELYEWKDSVLHAKAIIVDDDWCTIGSYNLNPLSKYGGIEMNASIIDSSFNEHFKNHFEKDILPNCTKMNLIMFKQTKLISKIIDRFCYVISRFIFRFIKFFDQING